MISQLLKANMDLLNHFQRYQSEPQYRVKCHAEMEREIAFMQLEKMLSYLSGVDADISQYKEMDTEELQATRRKLLQEANDKVPKYSSYELRKLLCN